CEIKPGIETRHKKTAPLTWSVAGVDRASAYAISERDGRAAYGGTPSDQTVVAAIRDLKARGLNVTLTPFILMDVAEGNALPDPYGGSGQPAYAWRGDRKSTRLNSSHSQISYAVFCLKKKK